METIGSKGHLDKDRRFQVSDRELQVEMHGEQAITISGSYFIKIHPSGRSSQNVFKQAGIYTSPRIITLWILSPWPVGARSTPLV